MHTAARLAVYGTAVVLLGAGAFVIGSALEAPADYLRPAAQQSEAAGHGGGHGPALRETAAAPGAAAAEPAGLASTANGYTMVPVSTTVPSKKATEVAFRILGPDGAPVTGFDVSHEKRMHLIVTRSDTADFKHVHPRMAADGTWRVPIVLAGGGTYRAFADFVPTRGEATTLGVDLFAPGQFTPVAPRPNRTATAPGGYQVRFDGDLVPGRASDVTLTVLRNGRPVTDLQPYLGAYGHLVALRSGDLGYLHVHPEGMPGDGATAPGPRITFTTEVPSAGTYRLFLDFQHEGTVRTAQFTIPTAGTATPAIGPAAPAGDAHDEGGH